MDVPDISFSFHHSDQTQLLQKLQVDLIIRKKEKTLQSWKICLSSKRQSILIFLSKFGSFWEKRAPSISISKWVMLGLFSSYTQGDVTSIFPHFKLLKPQKCQFRKIKYKENLIQNQWSTFCPSSLQNLRLVYNSTLFC